MKFKYKGHQTQYLTPGKVYFGQFVNGPSTIGSGASYYIMIYNDINSWAVVEEIYSFEPV